MLIPGAYINGLGIVSPQGMKAEDLYAEFSVPEDVCIKSKTPDYKGVIEPTSIRRLSSILKMAVYSAKTALADSGVKMPDAIITGTGLGCIEDTEKFLKAMIPEEGSTLSPTPFIFSTHNTISSTVAIALNCMGYNSTYVHRTNSFESALTDAALHLSENISEIEKNILVGGADEITHAIFETLGNLDFWKKERGANNLFESTSKGTIAGEGVTYFVLSNKRTSNSYARLDAVKTVNSTPQFSDLKISLDIFLKESGVAVSDIDLLLMGNNGDIRFDNYYKEMANLFPSSTTEGYYKHLCGESFTSSAFGLYVAALGIKRNQLPESCIMKKGTRPFKKVLLYNQFLGAHHSFYILSHV